MKSPRRLSHKVCPDPPTLGWSWITRSSVFLLCTSYASYPQTFPATTLYSRSLWMSRYMYLQDSLQMSQLLCEMSWEMLNRSHLSPCPWSQYYNSACHPYGFFHIYYLGNFKVCDLFTLAEPQFLHPKGDNKKIGLPSSGKKYIANECMVEITQCCMDGNDVVVLAVAPYLETASQ